ncbi:MAG: ATP-dependent DNA helicase RecG [Campylobacter sp.]|nr:ATP-dependent DNA helicase RecG [Campylobacter sp.]
MENLSILDIALLIPYGYDDLSLSEVPTNGEVTVEIVCKSYRTTPGRLIIKAWCKTWEMEVSVVIFHAKKWHYGAFGSGKELFIHARAGIYGGEFQFVNPKVVTKIGQILPKYKATFKPETIKELTKNLNYESLKRANLNDNEIKFILDIHKNDKFSVEIISNLGENRAHQNILKFIEILNYMQKLRKKKTIFKARKFSPNEIENWIESLPFRPTDDQLNALNDIKNDFLSSKASKRVIMGDVGSGKTLVMLGAFLMAGKGLIMAPTSILSEQIYNEAISLLPKTCKVLLVQSGDKIANFDEFDLIIGTHVLLYQTLPPLPLVMVDEQHRFGANQRQKIDKLTRDGEFRAHFLQFSATPIPRTLSLIESEIVSFSFLKQMPYPKNIQTIIAKNSDFKAMLEHIKTQISNHKQVIIVYPLVEESELNRYQSLNEATPFWQKRFKNLFVTHGKDRDKEQILREFRDSGDILLATTIVEVGISLPRLSTIIIVGAENFGLATLHQLRGRVSRKGGLGWCYLFTKLKDTPQRLVKFANTIDGFEVAKIDLNERKSGDLLDGRVQHGDRFRFYNFEENITLMAKERLNTLKFKANI